MAYSARPTSTNELTQLVNLTAHGFSVGQVLIYDGAWTLAQANTAADCAGCVIVSIVPDVNSFYVTQTGYILNTTASYTTGQQYYLSASSAGNLTLSAPASPNIVVPCFVADTSTSGYFYGGSGIVSSGGGSSFTWSIVSVNTAMLSNHGYLTSTGSSINLALPTTAAVGDIIRVSNLLGTFVITQASGQVISLGDEVTTTGTGGSIASTAIGDSIELICVNANVDFQALSSMGNLTVV